MKKVNSISKYNFPQRQEEIQDIIDRMPTRFGKIITCIVVGIFVLLLALGWGVRYPDFVQGTVVINTAVPPVKLVVSHAGQMNLNGLTSQSSVKKDDPVAVIENGVSYDTLRRIKALLAEFDPSSHLYLQLYAQLPPKISLGEVTAPYYAFLTSLHQLYNFYTDKIYDKQLLSMQKLHAEQLREMDIEQKDVLIAEENDVFANKSFMRDSSLYREKVTAEAEFDRSRQAWLGSKSMVNIARGNFIASRKEYQLTEGRMTELIVQKQEKRRELELNMLAAYNDLVGKISDWERKYLLKAPFDGQVQFLKFWADKQFVQAGEPVFTIVPDAAHPYGQVTLPALGAGKVKEGQEVIVKLNDYPYLEYGSISGKVVSISLTANALRTRETPLDNYLVTISFEEGLTTNYGHALQFRHESGGTAEIITNDRRLLERLFDNLKYAFNK